jgi:hypothetical protein
MSESLERRAIPQFLITADGDIHGEDTPANRELVRRIYACVNACEGISTEELERGLIADMRRVIGQVAPLLAEKKADLEQRVQSRRCGERKAG